MRLGKMRPSTLTILAMLLVAFLSGAGHTMADVAPGEAVDVGNHVKLHFRIPLPSVRDTVVVGMQDAHGDVIMFGYVDDDVLYVTDGAEGGIDRPAIAVPRTGSIGSVWHRVDVLFHGDTYTLQLNQRGTVTARTFTHATAGTWIPDPRSLGGSDYDEVLWARPRVDDSAMAYDETFSDDVTTWEVVEDGAGGAVEVQPYFGGHQGVGRVRLVSPLGLGTAYLRAPTTGHGGTYTAEASFGPSSYASEPPDEFVVLAGLSGDAEHPDVQWALALDRRLPDLYDWGLVFVDADGHHTPVGPSWHDFGWHHVRARVDEAAGVLTLSIDGEAPVDLTGDPGVSTHVGVGEIDAGLTPTLGTRFFVDDVVLYEEVS